MNILKHPGRPTGESLKSVLAHAIKTAPDPLLPLEDPEPRLYGTSNQPLCPICTKLLDSPIELGCGTIICLSCCKSWIEFHQPLSCPCCYFPVLDSEHIRPPPPLVTSFVEGLLVYCVRGCGKVVRVGQYQEHLKGACQQYYHQLVDSPSRLTIREVLSRPSSSPATPVEVKVAGHLVRKIMGENSSEVFQIPQHGQASKLYVTNITTLHNNTNKSTANHLGTSNQQQSTKL